MLLCLLSCTPVNHSTYWKFCRCRTQPWRRGPRSWPWPSCASCWAAGGAAACAAAWKAAWRQLGCRTCPTSSGFSAAMSSSSPTTKHDLTSPSSHLRRGRKEERGRVIITSKMQIFEWINRMPTLVAISMYWQQGEDNVGKRKLEHSVCIHHTVLTRVHKYVPPGQRVTFGVKKRHRKGLHWLVKSKREGGDDDRVCERRGCLCDTVGISSSYLPLCSKVAPWSL